MDGMQDEFPSYDLQKILRIGWRRKRAIFIVLLSTLLMACLLALVLPREYEAKMLLLMRLDAKDLQLPGAATGEHAWVSISLQKKN